MMDFIEKRTHSKSVWALFIGIFLFLCFLNAIFPTQSDDMGEGIGGLSAALRSFYKWNGRIGELLRVAFGSYFATTPYYAPINALFGTSVIFMIFPVIFARLPKTSLKDMSVLFILITFLLFDPAFSFGSFFYWAAGSFNYITFWFFILLHLLPYRFYWQSIYIGKVQETDSKKEVFLKMILVLLTGFLAGWAGEFAIVFIFLHCCFITYSFIKQRKLPLWYIPGSIALFIGFLLLYTCPGTSGRIKGILAAGGDYISLKEILGNGFYFFMRTILSTYERKSIRWICGENLVLISVFLLIVCAFYKPSIKKFIVSLANIFCLAASLFFLSPLFFLILSIFCLVLYAFHFRKINNELSTLYALCAGILFVEFLFIGATIQSSYALVARARFQYTILNFIFISIIMKYCFDTFKDKKNVCRIAFVFCFAVTLLFAAFVSAECYRMRLKWNAMVVSVEKQKQAGSKNIVVDKATFRSAWWNYGDWGRPTEDIKDWCNERCAKFFGVETFVVK